LPAKATSAGFKTVTGGARIQHYAPYCGIASVVHYGAYGVLFFTMQSITEYINRVILGDCIEVMRTMPAASVDFILTDPPYIVRYASRDGRRIASDDNSRWLIPAFAECYRALKPHRYAVSFYGWSQVHRFMAAWRQAGFVPVSHLVFAKDYASKQGFTKSYHECAYLLVKGNPQKPATLLPDVLPWRYTGNGLHPTQKPVMALAPLILAFSEPDDVVLDPFAGSGTTARAAALCGRRYIAIEKDAQYHRIARERLTRTARE
jgi:site-specific DNA-methyltransferase (adenine-specific)